MPRPDLGSPPGCSRGFTLLEVLVALLIFGLVFGVLAQIFQTGFRQSSNAESITTATLLARSQLARVGIDLPLEIGETEEADGDFRVRTTVEVAASEPGATEPEEPEIGLIPLLVRVAVAWGPVERERRVALTTLRLGSTQVSEGP